MGGGRYRPLKYKEVIKILKNLGFSKRPQKATSHEQWARNSPTRYKVTVDKPKAPFTRALIKSMASQAGISKRQFYAALDKNKAQKLAKKKYGDE